MTDKSFMAKKSGLFILLILFALGIVCADEEEKLVPPPRWGHSAIYDESNNQMLIFGGNDKTGALSDIWSFDLEKKTWKKIETEEVPTARSGHSAIYDPINKQMVVFGGDGGGGLGSIAKYLSDTWVFDLEKKTWKEIETKEVPPKRARHSTIYDSVNKQMIIFGGIGEGPERAVSDTWAYDIEKKEWKKIKTKKTPHPMTDHSTVYDSVNKQMLIFGGNEGKGPISDTWAFDIEKKTWKKIKAEEAPPPRAYHSAIYDPINKQMIIFAGGLCSDIWSFDIEQKTWVDETDNPPLPRLMHSAIYDPINKQMVIFGGSSNGNKEGLLSETWVFDIERKQWKEIESE